MNTKIKLTKIIIQYERLCRRFRSNLSVRKKWVGVGYRSFYRNRPRKAADLMTYFVVSLNELALCQFRPAKQQAVILLMYYHQTV
ncbi:MAG: hypothetical protein KatS3mg105_1885 [Gemmatales bacterium]|nr:MAG: hypothetical protein KatS3mg105_1885 [Gemmatales bacterium]